MGKGKAGFFRGQVIYSSHCREWNIIMVAYLSAVHRCPSGFLSSTCLNQYLSSPHPWNLIFFLNLLPSTLPSCTSVPLIWFLGCLCLLFLMLTYIQSSSSHPSNIPLVIAWSLFLKKSSYLITTSPTTNFYWFPYCIQNNIPRPQPALQKVYLKPSFPFLISFSLLSVSQTVSACPHCCACTGVIIHFRSCLFFSPAQPSPLSQSLTQYACICFIYASFSSPLYCELLGELSLCSLCLA